jgi:hypothetical protein
MSDVMTASELMQQARETVHDYMLYARSAIIDHFGQQWFDKNPDAASRIIASMITASATDFDTGIRYHYPQRKSVPRE